MGELIEGEDFAPQAIDVQIMFRGFQRLHKRENYARIPDLYLNIYTIPTRHTAGKLILHTNLLKAVLILRRRWA